MLQCKRFAECFLYIFKAKCKCFAECFFFVYFWRSVFSGMLLFYIFKAKIKVKCKCFAECFFLYI